ncbi:conserved protein of unknown function [Streptococcus thermophilus]|nr:conserved protein of unknown function [Streptococcus thermophilus]
MCYLDYKYILIFWEYRLEKAKVPLGALDLILNQQLTINSINYIEYQYEILVYR